MSAPLAERIEEMEGPCNFREYLDWEGPERFEVVQGEAVLLAAPSPSHQEISFEICRQLGNFLEGKKCKAYAAPFDVRLFERERDSPEDVDTVIQPDITVICDRSKIDERGCKGAPDVAIEILSPSTQRHDRLVKFNLYQRSGLGELWFVDPANRSVEVFLRDGQGMLRPVGVYRPKDTAKVNSLEGCFIEMGKVFPEG